MLNVTKVEELERTNHYLCLIYGEPGVGKTTFALTASNPLLLDCDNRGSERVKLDTLANADCALISSFKELEDITKEDIEPYQTIIIDTFGALIEYATRDITLGAPNPKQWGQIRTKVLNFLNKLAHKNIIALAHANTVNQETSSNKITKIEPQAQGSSIDSFITSCSIVGFMSRNGAGRTTISFSGGEATQGKNTFDFPPMVISPDDTKAFQKLEQKITSYRQAEQEKQKQFKDIWIPLRAKIEQATTPEQFTALRNEYLQADNIFNLHEKARMLLYERNNLPQFQFEFDTVTQTFKERNKTEQ